MRRDVAHAAARAGWGKAEEIKLVRHDSERASRYISVAAARPRHLAVNLSPAFVPGSFFMGRPRAAGKKSSDWLLKAGVLAPMSISVEVWSTKKEAVMTMNLLRQIATSRLPISFYRSEDIDQVRILRAAGLVVAWVPAASHLPSRAGDGAAAQVIAITQKGRRELADFDVPRSGAPLGVQPRAPLWRQRIPRIFTRLRRSPPTERPGSSRMQ